MAYVLGPPHPQSHRCIKFLWVQMSAEKITAGELCRRAGFSKQALSAWWTGTRLPSMENMEAALGVFGYTLKPTPIEEKRSMK